MDPPVRFVEWVAIAHPWARRFSIAEPACRHRAKREQNCRFRASGTVEVQIISATLEDGTN
jgi:hypothetical protein